VTPNDLDIRPIIQPDLPALIALYGHLSPEDTPIDLASAQQYLSSLTSIENCLIIGGWHARSLVTTCTVFVLPNLTRSGRPYALIENVVTDEALRGRGFGKQILSYATDHAFDHGCYKVMLMTGSTTPQTLSFYQSAGFTQNKTGFQKRNLPIRP